MKDYSKKIQTKKHNNEVEIVFIVDLFKKLYEEGITKSNYVHHPLAEFMCIENKKFLQIMKLDKCLVEFS